MNPQSFPLAIQVEIPSSHWDGGMAVDLPAPAGTAWLAVFDGQASSYWNDLAGNSLKLRADDGTVAYYAHGQVPGASGRVSAGQVIGQVGSTGSRSSGPHLHFAVGSSIDANGWGTIRPIDWFNGPPGPAPGPAPGEVSTTGSSGGMLVLLAAAIILSIILK